MWPPKVRPRARLALTCLILLLAAADVATTARLVSIRGVSEGNPFVAAILVHGGVAVFAICKAALLVAILACLHILEARPRMRLLFAASACVVLAAPVVWNVHELLLLR